MRQLHTLLVAVDREHNEQLKVTWPTWMKHRPELRDWPMLLVVDTDQLTAADVAWIDHPNMHAVAWGGQQWKTQREKMLSALIYVPALYCRTPWYLKLDADTVAMRRERWPEREWFEPREDHRGMENAFISSPWGYSKPGDIVDRLDDWGDTVPQIARYPRLNCKRNPESSLVRHKRIISWCCFANTGYTQMVAMLCKASCGDRMLPVPSQDSVLFYVAKRMGFPYLRENMKKRGWGHYLRIKTLREKATEALA